MNLINELQLHRHKDDISCELDLVKDYNIPHTLPNRPYHMKNTVSAMTKKKMHRTILHKLMSNKKYLKKIPERSCTEDVMMLLWTQNTQAQICSHIQKHKCRLACTYSPCGIYFKKYGNMKRQ